MRAFQGGKKKWQHWFLLNRHVEQVRVAKFQVVLTELWWLQPRTEPDFGLTAAPCKGQQTSPQRASNPGGAVSSGLGWLAGWLAATSFGRLQFTCGNPPCLPKNKTQYIQIKIAVTSLSVQAILRCTT